MIVRLLLAASANLVLWPARQGLAAARRGRVLRRPRTLRLDLDVGVGAPRRRRLARRLDLDVLADLVDAAAAHPRVAGLFVRVERGDAEAVHWAEIAPILERFRRSGKPLHLHLDRLDNASLLVAGHATQVVTPPAATPWVHGIARQIPFWGDALGRLGVGLDVVRQGAYKGALDPLTESAPSAPFREAVEALCDDLLDTLASQAATSGRWEARRVRRWLEEGPWTTTDALAEGLLDATAHVDEAEDAIARAEVRRSRRVRTRDGQPPLATLPRIEQAGLRPIRPVPWRRPATVALVPVCGLIVDHPRAASPGRRVAVATALARLLGRLARQRGIDAVVLVVDSRGGTVTASDRLAHAVRQLRRHKPVVAWLRARAASGAYYAAVGADRIVASPLTLTGSIGVLAAHLHMDALARRLGVRTVTLGRGRPVPASVFETTPTWHRTWLERTTAEAYARFKEVVARGRGMSAEAVERVAQGRVWTGRQAHAHGLVDRLGTWADVRDTVRELASVPARRPLRVRWFAAPQRLRDALPGRWHVEDAADAYHDALVLLRDHAVAYYAALTPDLLGGAP